MSDDWHVPAASSVPPPAHAAVADARRQGRIALHLRAGVTGHRSIDLQDPLLARAIGDVLDLLAARGRQGSAATPVSLVVVSALAEGADRLVARQALARGAGLEVVLPLPPADYLTDFHSGTSRSEFRELLSRASAVTELAASGTRSQAYERAGQAIVDRCDVLIALWDGQPARGRGGTAEIVSYAQRQGVPVVQLPVERTGAGSPHPQAVSQPELPMAFPLLSDEAFRQLDRFNSMRLRPRSGSAPLLPERPVPGRVHSFAAYAQPYFDRADQVAKSSQRLFVRLTLLLYSLAAAAVVIVATQVIFFFDNPKIVWAEVAALLGVVLTLVFGRRGHWHDRWLAVRSLAERIRSGVFLAAVGGGQDLQRTASPLAAEDRDRPAAEQRPGARASTALRYRARRAGHALRSRAGRMRMFWAGDGHRGRGSADLGRPVDPASLDPNQEWVERAFREIYWRGPGGPAGEPELPELRDLLVDAWIDDQMSYHLSVSDRLTRRQRQLNLLAISLFAVSALVALFHSMSILQEPSEPDVWGYLSVVIPAIGAALSGYSAQREYARLAERSRLMVKRLDAVRHQVSSCSQLSSLQRAASRTETLMRSETAEWYDVVRLHDFEVPS